MPPLTGGDRYLSNKSQPNFISLNCQSGKYQRVLIARAFTYCVKIGLMSCQFCGVRSPMFAEIGWAPLLFDLDGEGERDFALNEQWIAGSDDGALARFCCRVVTEIEIFLTGS